NKSLLINSSQNQSSPNPNSSDHHSGYEFGVNMEGKRISMQLILLLIACFTFQLCFSDSTFYESFDEPFEGRQRKMNIKVHGNTQKVRGMMIMMVFL
ncbi:hypothetical protein GIB67_041698, partial [Kingdonia uniflora]